jgi:predicted esterase
MILIFLHGKGADKSAYHDEIEKLASDVGAEVISFNAPFLHPEKQNKYVWFNKFEQNGRRDAVTHEYSASLRFIKERLRQLPYPLSDIVLVGHSQGGGMAVSVALELNLKCAISICGDLPYNLTYQNNSKTPIYWLEGGSDEYISQERKDSYKILENLGVDLDYRVVSGCSHTAIQRAFIEVGNILRAL